jgi:hypothetical protein
VLEVISGMVTDIVFIASVLAAQENVFVLGVTGRVGFGEDFAAGTIPELRTASPDAGVAED